MKVTLRANQGAGGSLRYVLTKELNEAYVTC